MLRPRPTSALFPYTTLFRSRGTCRDEQRGAAGRGSERRDAACALVRARDLRRLPRGARPAHVPERTPRSEEHTSELQSQSKLVCRLLLEKKKTEFPSECFTV